MSEFDDEATPLPPPPPSQRDPWFPTGRQPAISPGAKDPHEAMLATSKMWKVLRAGDTARMSADEIAAAIPLKAPFEDSMRTMRVDAAVFRPTQPPPWRERLRPFAIPVLTFAAGLALGILL